MDEKCLLLPESAGHHHHGHDHHRRKRHCFVAIVFIGIILASSAVIWGHPGFEQRNSLLHHNEIINSSIIINIIINGRNRTRSELEEDFSGPIDDQLIDRAFDVDRYNNIDPNFNIQVEQAAEPYQKPDIGLVRIFDHPPRASTMQDTTEKPE